jgi:hypothetical protein
MTADSDNQKIKLTWNYDYPQGMPCGAVMLYTQKDDNVILLTTIRDASVGEGRSLSGGGFYNMRDIFMMKGYNRPGSRELYREMCEELGGEEPELQIPFKKIVPYRDFLRNAEIVWDGAWHVPGTQFVHSIIQKSLKISDDQMRAILKLPRTKEQKGKVLETFNLKANISGTEIRGRLSDFRYPVEQQGAVRWIRQRQRALAA